MNDILLALGTGIDIPIPELKIIIHQPEIIEISYIGEKNFLLGTQTLSINKNMVTGQGNSILENTTNFQIFMAIMQEKETQDKKNAVKSLFQLIFPNYKVIITPNSILFNQDDNETIVIDDSNFDILQNVIKQIFCIDKGSGDQAVFNPADDPKAKEIAAKLMRGRERVAAQKGENNSSVLGRYISILAIGVPMPISDIVHLTIYQLYDMIERYSLYLNWDLDVRTRLAGGKPDGKPEDWMKNIH